MASRLTKTQKKEIAEMWAAGLLIQCDGSSFDSSISENDADDILTHVDKIAIKLAKGRKQHYSLIEIIQQATKPKQ
jgi:hypothetical protein